MKAAHHTFAGARNTAGSITLKTQRYSAGRVAGAAPARPEHPIALVRSPANPPLLLRPPNQVTETNRRQAWRCATKPRFPSIDAALAARRTTSSTPVIACRFCGFYHLGRVQTETQP